MWIPDSVWAVVCPRTRLSRAARRADTDRRRGGASPASVAAEGGRADRGARVLTVAWTPPDAFAASPAGRTARHGISDARSLAERAAADPDWYWAAGMEDLGIPWMRPYDTVVDRRAGSSIRGSSGGGSTGPTSRWTVTAAGRGGPRRLVGGRRRRRSP